MCKTSVLHVYIRRHMNMNYELHIYFIYGHQYLFAIFSYYLMTYICLVYLGSVDCVFLKM